MLVYFSVYNDYNVFVLMLIFNTYGTFNFEQEQLVDVKEDLFNFTLQKKDECRKNSFWTRQRIEVDDLIRGALEAAFVSFVSI